MNGGVWREGCKKIRGAFRKVEVEIRNKSKYCKLLIEREKVKVPEP